MFKFEYNVLKIPNWRQKILSKGEVDMKRLIVAILVCVLLLASIPLSVTAESYEYAMFPMTHMKIKQGVNESFSHQGTKAIDITGIDTGIDAAYAPFTGVVKRIYQGYVVWLESLNPVIFADGTIDYMTIMVMHDNDTSDLSVGQIINQGDHFFDEGTAGYAEGNHIHLECAKGKFQGTGWYENNYGYWTIYNSILPYDALYISSSTVVLNGYGYDWKKVNDDTFTYSDITLANYSIKNISTGKYLDVHRNLDLQDQNISLCEYNGGLNQKYQVIKQDNGYVLRPLMSETRVVNARADNVTSGINVCLWDDTGHVSQRWNFEETTGGYFIRNAQNPRCVLDVEGDNVCVKNYSGAQSQIWALEEVIEIPYDVWDGSTANSFASGTGTQYNPYIIEDGAQLRYLVSLGAEETKGKYYKLANDIYLNTVYAANWYEASNLNQWPVIEVNTENAFCGNFNGAGHVVYGLYVNHKTANTTPTTDVAEDRDIDVAAGLFPVVGNGAVIDAVGVEKANITIKNSVTDDDTAVPAGLVGAVVGAFVGDNRTVKVGRCYAADNVALYGAFVGLIGGGASQNGTGVSVTNCYSLLSWIVRTSHDGNNRAGIIGRQSGGATFSGCFGIGNVAGAIVSKGAVDNYVTAWTSNAGTAVSIDNIYGGETAKTAMPELDWENVYDVTSSHPVLRVFSNNEDEDEVWEHQCWSDLCIKPATGTGSAEDPFLIFTAEELAYIVKNGTPENTYYKLAEDIYLNDITKVDWTTGKVENGYIVKTWFNYDQVGEHHGIIDGNGHMVYGLYYKDDTTDCWSLNGTGLFPKSDGGLTITKLGVDYAYIKHPHAAGAFVGGASRHNHIATTIDQCFVGAKSTIVSHSAGAFVGAADSTLNITNAYSLATTVFTYRGGSLVGEFYSNCGKCGPANSTFKYIYNANGKIANQMAVTAEALYVTVEQKGATTLTVAEMQGLDVVTTGKMSGLGDKFLGTDTYPVLAVFAACTHSYGDWEIVKEATTQEAGLKRKVCSACGDETTERIPIIISLPGGGSAKSPYLISNKDDLAYIIKIGGEGAYYKLTSDIYINDISKINWKTGEVIDSNYTPSVWFTSDEVPSFNGNVDGDGHVIYGMYYKQTDTGSTPTKDVGAGLFPEYEKVNVTRLGFDSAYMEFYAQWSLGAIFGLKSGDRTAPVTVDRCYVGENVTLKGYDVGGMFGGGVTKGTEIVITNSYVLADLVGTNWVGAFVADTWKYNSEIPSLWVFKNCYTVSGRFIGKLNMNPADGSINNYSTVGDAVDTKIIYAENIRGKNAQQVMTGLDWETVYATTDSGFPVLRIFGQTKEPSAPLEFKGASLTLHSNLAINYKVDKTLFEEVGYTAPYVLFMIGDTETKVSKYTVSGDYYVFDFTNIAPHQIGDTVYATLYATYDGKEYASEVKEYGVSAYCYNMLGKYTTDEYAELKTLLVDLLNYGAQSQIYMDYNTDKLVNEALTDEQIAWGTADAPETESVLEREYETVDSPSAYWAGAGLNLKNSVTVRLILKAQNIDGMSVKITDGEKSWTVNSSKFETAGEYYYVYFSGLDAAGMSKSIYATVLKDGVAVSNTLRYSVESYAHSKVGGADIKLSDLLSSMMKYGNSAYAFKN